MSDTTPAQPKPPRTYAARRPKVAPFARFIGTSAWHKYPRRAHEYARFLAETRKHPTP